MTSAMPGPHVYEHVMQIASPLLALSFWTIVIVMAANGYRRGTWRKHALMWFWCVNVALWWSVVTFLRWTAGYNAPTITMSFWSTITFIQAAISMLVWFVLSRYRRPLPGDKSIYDSPEFGPDDN